MTRDRDDLRCPVCGVGVLVDLTFEPGAGQGQVPRNDPTARQVTTYSCGHERMGLTLESADEAHLAVERRTSEETVDPVPPRDDAA